MAIEVGTAYISILPSTDKLAAGIKRDLAGTDRLGKQAGAGYVGGFKSALGPLTAAVSAAAVGNFLKGAVKEASDLGESVNALNVTYGKHSKAIQTLGKDAADALGLSNVEFNSLAVRFSGFANTIAGEGGDVVGTLDDLTTRAADFASVMNLDVAEAAELFQSGLAGETEPLRRFGIDLSAAAVEAHALAVGIHDGAGEMSEAEKVQARYSLLMSETAETQGDFANTSDSLANVQRRLAANTANLRAEIGEKLLPVAEDLSNWMLNDGLPLLHGLFDVTGDVAGVFMDIPGPVKAVGGALVALRVAKHVGIMDHLSTAMQRVKSGVETARIQTMLAGDAFRNSRADVGTMRAGLVGLGGAARGAGSAMKGMFGGALSAAGGPWGVALMGAAAAVTFFYGQQREAKAEVEALTATLDEQTGALTDNSREWVVKELVDSGAMEQAKELGLDLSMLTDAALGSDEAMALLRDEVSRLRDEGEGGAATDIMNSVLDTNEVVEAGTAAFVLHEEAMGDDTDAAEKNTAATDANREAKKKAREAIIAKIDAMREERQQSLRGINAELDYAAAIDETSKELRKGKQTLDKNTEAGRENWNAILDRTTAYNELEAQQGRTVEQYKEERKWLIRTMTQMGLSREEAVAYADELLNIPKKWVTRASFEDRQARRAVQAYKDYFNEQIDNLRGKDVPINVIASTAKAARDANAMGYSGMGGAGGSGGSGVIRPVVNKVFDRDAIESDILGTLATKIDDLRSAFMPGGKMGPAGRVLPKGSYRIGMPYLGYPGHYGADYPAAAGTPVFSPYSGRVTASYDLRGSNPYNDTPYRSYGRLVRVAHAAGESLFAHLTSRLVSAGQTVSAGQQIGTVGTTGNSTGPHLHYEYRRGGRTINPASLGIFDKGGILEPGAIAVNLSRKPEAVFNHKQFQQFADSAMGGEERRFPDRVTLVVGDKKFDAYVRELADDTYAGERAYSGTVRRMGGR